MNSFLNLFRTVTENVVSKFKDLEKQIVKLFQNFEKTKFPYQELKTKLRNAKDKFTEYSSTNSEALERAGSQAYKQMKKRILGWKYFAIGAEAFLSFKALTLIAAMISSQVLPWYIAIPCGIFIAWQIIDKAIALRIELGAQDTREQPLIKLYGWLALIFLVPIINLGLLFFEWESGSFESIGWLVLSLFTLFVNLYVLSFYRGYHTIQVTEPVVQERDKLNNEVTNVQKEFTGLHNVAYNQQQEIVSNAIQLQESYTAIKNPRPPFTILPKYSAVLNERVFITHIIPVPLNFNGVTREFNELLTHWDAIANSGEGGSPPPSTGDKNVTPPENTPINPTKVDENPNEQNKQNTNENEHVQNVNEQNFINSENSTEQNNNTNSNDTKISSNDTIV